MSQDVAGNSGDSGDTVTIEPWLREILRCPACGSTLRDGSGPSGPDGQNLPELQCESDECGLAYRIDGGVPVLLVDEARPTRG